MATCSYRGVRWALRNELTVSSFEKRPLPPSYISYIRSVGAAPSLDGDEAERVLEQAMMCASHRVDGLTCGPTLEGLVSPHRLLGCIDECPKHQFSIRTVRLCGQLARAYPVAGRMLRERLPSLDPASVLTPDTPAQHISGLLTACSAVSFVPQRVLDAALALLASPGGVSALTPRRLALTLRSIVTLVPPDEPASACNTALLADVRRAVRRRLHRGEGRAVAQMSAGHVACTVWFLARTAPAGGAAATEEAAEEEEVLALLVARFLETAADVTEESGVGGLSEAAHEDDLLSPKDATMMLWGLRKLGRQDSAPFHRVYRLIHHGVVPVSLMSGVDIALLVHVLCKRRDVIVKVYESGARGVRGNVNVLTHLCNAFVLLLRTCAAPADSGCDAGDADAHGPTVRNLHVVLGGYAHIGLIDGQMPKLLQAATDAWPRHLCDTGNLHEGAALARHLAALLAARVVAAEALLKMVLLAVPSWVAAAEDGYHKRRAVTSLVRTISGTVARRGVPFCPQHLAALAPLLAHLLRDAKACANASPLVAALEACAAEGGTRLGGHVAQIFRLLAKVRAVLATSSYTAVAAAAAAAAAAPGAADGGKALREVLGKGCRERFGLVPKGVARGDVPQLVRALSSAGQWKRETYGSVAAGVLTTAVAEFAADGGGTPGSAKVRLGRLACVSEAWTLLMGPKRAGKLSPHTVAELHSGSVVILEAAQRALRDAVAEVAEGVAVPLREAVVAMRGTPLCVLSCATRGPAAVRAVAQVAVAVAERPGASKAELEACMEVVVETLQWRRWYGKRQPKPPELLLSALHSLVDRGRCAVSFRDAVAILKVVHMHKRPRRKRRKEEKFPRPPSMSRQHLLETVRHRQMAVAAGKRLQAAARRMFERKITPAQAATEGGLFTPTEVHWTLPAATDAAEGPENSATHETNAPPAQFEGLKINECLKIMVRRQRPAAPPAIWTLTPESVAATTLFPIRLAAEDALRVKQQRAQAELDPTFFASASEQAHEQQQESAGPSNGDALPSPTEPPHTLSTVAAVSAGKGGIATT